MRDEITEADGRSRSVTAFVSSCVGVVGGTVLNALSVMSINERQHPGDNPNLAILGVLLICLVTGFLLGASTGAILPYVNKAEARWNVSIVCILAGSLSLALCLMSLEDIRRALQNKELPYYSLPLVWSLALIAVGLYQALRGEKHEDVY